MPLMLYLPAGHQGRDTPRVSRLWLWLATQKDGCRRAERFLLDRRHLLESDVSVRSASRALRGSSSAASPGSGGTGGQQGSRVQVADVRDADRRRRDSPDAKFEHSIAGLRAQALTVMPTPAAT